jgi:DHA1 family tetracycline resistance protein-like MFS transporter
MSGWCRVSRSASIPRRGLSYLLVFAAAAVGAGLVRTVATTYLPVMLADLKDSPGLIGTVMIINAVSGFAVPLSVGIWSDRRHSVRHGRRPFIAWGSLVAAAGLAAVALGARNSFFLAALFGLVAYVGVNAVTTAHRALVHDCFEDGSHARANGAQEVAMLLGALLGLVAGGLLSMAATWAPFVLAAVAMPLLAWPTLRRVPVPSDLAHRALGLAPRSPVRHYVSILVRPGVRAMLAAEILWVLGYAALPVFFVLYAKNVLGLSTAVASLWLAGFVVVAGLVMAGAAHITTARFHKPALIIGVALMGAGFLAVAASSTLLTVSLAVIPAAVGFGLISTLGFSLFAAIIPRGDAGGYTALYFSLRAAAAMVALPLAGWLIAATGSYRSLFVLGGAATLAALLPLAFAPTPARASAMRAHPA